MADRYEDDRGNLRERDAYDRDRGRHDERYRASGSEDRGMVQRAGDEVRSWFGDDEAARRRRRDEERDELYGAAHYNRLAPERPFGSSDYYNERSRSASYGSERGYGANDGSDRGYGSGYRTGSHFDRGYQSQQRNPYGPSQYGGMSNIGYGSSGEGRFGSSNRAGNRPSDWSGPERDWDRSSPAFGRSQQSADWQGGYGRESNFGRQTSFDRQSAFEQNDRQDWSQRHAWSDQGPHFGRGPRGYQRSDDRIREDICDRLTRHGRIDATDITIRVLGGEVTLDGTVDTREAKRLAEEVAESVDGVRDVTNHLKASRGWNDDSWNRGQSNRDVTSGSDAGLGNPGTPSTLGLRGGATGTNRATSGGSTAATTAEKDK